jgi:uncharacterized protein with NRDE domain
VYGLSNGGLNDPWPKTMQAQSELIEALDARADTEPEHLTQALLAMLTRRECFSHGLPDTGIGAARERALSPVYIDLPDYGSRASSVVLVEANGTVHFTERDNDVDPATVSSFRFKLTAQPESSPRARRAAAKPGR